MIYGFCRMNIYKWGLFIFECKCVLGYVFTNNTEMSIIDYGSF